MQPWVLYELFDVLTSIMCCLYLCIRAHTNGWWMWPMERPAGSQCVNATIFTAVQHPGDIVCKLMRCLSRLLDLFYCLIVSSRHLSFQFVLTCLDRTLVRHSYSIGGGPASRYQVSVGVRKRCRITTSRGLPSFGDYRLAERLISGMIETR
ncbi:hypothetical protein IF2G_10222 [Cordyceps javanica]|nr:hypothetical protein IF2G_10222 [Cordyceps javanica]